MGEASVGTESSPAAEAKPRPIEASLADPNGGEILTPLIAWIRKTLHNFGQSIGSMTVFFVCLPAILTLWARSHWAIELLTHFRVYFALALAAGLLLCLPARTWRYVVVITGCLVWHATLIAPLYLAGPTTGTMPLGASYGEELRGMSVNVLSRNQQKAEVVAYLREEDPDFMFLMEISEGWVAALEELKEDYPHHFIQWRGGAFGVAFFSRVPTRSIDIEYLGSAEIPTLLAELTDSDGRDFTLVGTHPLPPTGESNSKMRNEQLAAVAAKISRMSGAVMLMGDLNTTGWSPCFEDLLENAGLHDTRAGFGVHGTWAPNPNIPLRLPIDHVLTTEEFFIRDRRVGPDIGSDHRPVVVDFHVLTKPVSAAD